MSKLIGVLGGYENRVRVFALLSCAFLAFVALLGYVHWHYYNEILRGARVETSNYAAIVEARLNATLRRTDARLLRVMKSLPDEALNVKAVPRFAESINASLDTKAESFAELVALRVFDANGDLLYASSYERAPQVKFDDDIVFRHARGNPQAGLLFSDARQIAVNGQYGIAAIRPLRDAQGTFRGLILALIDFGEYEKLFNSIDIGANGVLSIRRSDNFSAVLRRPFLAADMNRALSPTGNVILEGVRAGRPKGTAEVGGLFEERVRIYSYQLVSGFPFYVTAGLARGDVLAGWWDQTLAIAMASLLLLVIVVCSLRHLWHLTAVQDKK